MDDRFFELERLRTRMEICRAVAAEIVTDAQTVCEAARLLRQETKALRRARAHAAGAEQDAFGGVGRLKE